MRTTDLRQLISTNAEEIRRLHGRVHETLRGRGRSAEETERWKIACSEFHARYDALAFPGGYATAKQRLAAGDAYAIEAALCFVELRPYFFRSGYMYRALLPKLRKAALSDSQRTRLNAVLDAYERWRRDQREQKQSSSATP